MNPAMMMAFVLLTQKQQQQQPQPQTGGTAPPRSDTANNALIGAVATSYLPGPYKVVGAVIASDQVQESVTKEVQAAEEAVAKETAAIIAALPEGSRLTMPELEKNAPKLLQIAGRQKITLLVKAVAANPAAQPAVNQPALADQPAPANPPAPAPANPPAPANQPATPNPADSGPSTPRGGRS